MDGINHGWGMGWGWGYDYRPYRSGYYCLGDS